MENKTVANNASVKDFIDSLGDPIQRDDSRKLLQIFGRVTADKPVMWGAAIIGFGSVNLAYASGRKVSWMRAGFSPRKGQISLYVTFDALHLTNLFPNLGKYKIGKGCIYIKRLSDVDLDELEKLVKAAWKVGYDQQPKRKDGREKIADYEYKEW